MATSVGKEGKAMLRPVGEAATASLGHLGQREERPGNAMYLQALFKAYCKESFGIHVDRSFQFLKEEILSPPGEVSLL